MASSDADVRRYLRRLGFDTRPPATLDVLHALHRRHVERVAYENLGMQLGCVPSIHPAESLARVAAGRGGYCFHLNGAFSALLAALGYQVAIHRGQVKKHDADQPWEVAVANHLGLTVACAGREWFVDVGLGDGPHAPLPLAPGTHCQGPFRYSLRRTAGGWRFEHDRRGSFTVLDWADGPAAISDFAPAHGQLSTSPSSTFVRNLVVMRRTEHGFHSLVGRELRTVGRDGDGITVLDSREQWLRALEEVFLLPLSAFPAAELGELWARTASATASG